VMMVSAMQASAQSNPVPTPGSEAAEPADTLPEQPVPGAGVPPAIFAQAEAAFSPMCTFDPFEGPGYKAYELTYKAEGDAADQAARKATLHELFCMAGAYNYVSVYLLSDDYGETYPLQFAEPAYTIVYEDDDFEKSVLRIDVRGFTTDAFMVNAGFDPQTGELTTFSKWRGIGDASSSARYNFLGGQFVLTHYEVDASYDDEINPLVIYDASAETP
jgi:hypothetical protein